MSDSSKRVNRLFRATDEVHDPAACDACQAALAEYVDAELAGLVGALAAAASAGADGQPDAKDDFHEGLVGGHMYTGD